MPASKVQKVLRQKLQAYASCYEAARTRKPGLRGRFTVRFRIEPAGTVSTVEVRGAGADATFTTCLADIVKSLSFPKPRGGEVDVVYPLDFSEA